MDKHDLPFLLFLFLLVGVFLGMMLSTVVDKRMIRKELIEKNVAHWSIDSKTGERTFISPYKFSEGK